MHIFTDESGTGQDEVFLVSGIMCTAERARAVLKPLRKACKIKGELHATHLDERQRAKAFRMLMESPVSAAVVRCIRAETHGGWALKSVREDLLWAHLHGETAASLLKRTESGHCTGVTADTGKFTRTMREGCKKDIEQIVQASHLAGPVVVDNQDSQRIPGLQLADLVANVTYRALLGTASQAEVRAHRYAVESGWLTIAPLELKPLTPPWLSPSDHTKSRPETERLLEVCDGPTNSPDE